MTFINTSKNAFDTVTGEAKRTYVFIRDGSKHSVDVYGVTKICITDNGHRLFCEADGSSYFIPTGWISLEWTVDRGQPNFSK